VPASATNIELKPYAISNLTSDVNARPRISNDLDADIGIDAKYGINQNLTADFTYNTDFAQVEADEQQVNLTRFSLFFPEKRDFFLENQGIFSFGGAVTAGATAGTGDVPVLFYSRRIGLDAGRVVPIEAGGRLTGRLGRFSVGLLNMQSDRDPITDAPGANFTVARLKRDILRKSSIGALVTARSVGPRGGRNDAYGVDGAFSFYDNLTINTYWAQTRTDGLAGEETSYRAQLDYAGDRYGVQLERLAVGDAFNPEVGFIQRLNMRRSFGLFRFSPRLNSPRVRKIGWTGSVKHIANGTTGRLETRESDVAFTLDFQNSDQLTAGVLNTYDFLPLPFRVGRTTVLPVGEYDFTAARIGFTAGRQRKLSGSINAELGTFYTGDRKTLSLRGSRVNLSSQLTIEPSFSVNWIDLTEGSFTTTLVGTRVIYTVTPLMFTSALIQYNTDTQSVSSNVRLRWEYRPGSELFVVYNEQRDTLARRFPDLANRAFIIKVSRLLRF
jgi:hypothetical protein